MEEYTDIICALTHDLNVCDRCKKCGDNSAEVRVKLLNKLEELIKENENLKKYQPSNNLLEKLNRQSTAYGNRIIYSKQLEDAIDMACEELANKDGSELTAQGWKNMFLEAAKEKWR